LASDFSCLGVLRRRRRRREKKMDLFIFNDIIEGPRAP
jgi:hypothetical protein